ncbi:MAG: VOC family protein [Gammaproteobacteria bacterium]|nr:VOC family protein [Gammaproteobacteria bacterium]MYF53255.1 VOC family protein [Gammaproteobacteria bacterium]MYK43291.1 VOC family protein [Gammaproteobacteria bacterium]
MASINGYLTFNGNCREAMEFYRSIFGLDFESMMTFGDGPDGVGGSDSNRIMHASLPFESGTLMASDTADDDPNFSEGNNFSLCLDTDDKTQTDEWLAKLSDGGKVTFPAQKTFWGAYFAMCRDKFGINWMLMCEH